MSENIFAYTIPYNGYPAFVSVNTDDSKPGNIRLTVRSPKKEDGRCGDTAEISLSPEEFKKFALKLYGYATHGFWD